MAARLLLALTVLLASLWPSAAAAQAGDVRVTLFHDTHLHGNLWNSDGLTFGNLTGTVRRARAALPTPANALFLGNGDDVASSVSSAVFRGQHVVDAFNAAGLDATTFGNHDFDLGPDRLRELIRGSRYPYVTANVLDAGSGDAFASDLGVRRFLVKEVGGVKFGLTGLAPTETPTVSSPGPSVRFLDPSDAMREVLPQMRAAGAQVVVVLSHLCGPDMERVATAVPGIDVAIGDHCAEVLARPKVVNGAILSRRGDELRYVGQLDLNIRAGRVVGHGYVQHTVAKETTDPAVDAIVERYRAELTRALDAPAGTTSVPLVVNREVMRSAEAAAGNLVADALRDASKADVALVNGGGVRGETTFGPGTLKKADVVTMLPFPNYLTVLRVTGAQLREALENGVSQVAERAGRFPQVSGLSFTYDPAGAVGQRVLSVTVGGRALDPAGSYTLATADFLAGGGDGYTVLRGATVVLPAAAGPLMSNVVTEYLVARGSVAPAVEGRIRVGARAAAAPAPTQLPRTGAPLLVLVAAGLGLVAVGGMLRRR